MINPVTEEIEGNAIDDLLNERDELARENQFLRRELQDMGDLVRDYEKGMQAITASIRDHAVPSLLKLHTSNTIVSRIKGHN